LAALKVDCKKESFCETSILFGLTSIGISSADVSYLIEEEGLSILISAADGSLFLFFILSIGGAVDYSLIES